jgi:hypothetical protein
MSETDRGQDDSQLAVFAGSPGRSDHGGGEAVAAARPEPASHTRTHMHYHEQGLTEADGKLHTSTYEDAMKAKLSVKNADYEGAVVWIQRPNELRKRMQEFNLYNAVQSMPESPDNIVNGALLRYVTLHLTELAVRMAANGEAGAAHEGAAGAADDDAAGAADDAAASATSVARKSILHQHAKCAEVIQKAGTTTEEIVDAFRAVDHSDRATSTLLTLEKAELCAKLESVRGPRALLAPCVKTRTCR